MLGKLVFFAAGYVLGARAGRKRYEQIVRFAKAAVARDEVQMVAGMARTAIGDAIETGEKALAGSSMGNGHRRSA